MKTKNRRKIMDASLKSRLLAYGVDFIINIILLGTFLFTATIFFTVNPADPQGSFQMLCFMITVFILFCYIPSKYEGKTIGKIIFKIKVTSDEGKLPVIKTVLREFVLKFVMSIILVFISVIYTVFYITKNKSIDKLRLPHDLLLHTYVIND